jgi:hypothetical protein
MVTTENIQSVLSKLSIQLNIQKLQFDEDQSCFLAFDEQAVNIQYIQDKLYLIKAAA